MPSRWRSRLPHSSWKAKTTDFFSYFGTIASLISISANDVEEIQMSAPDVNLEKQSRRHRGPLVGIGFGLAVAAVLFAAYNFYVWEPVADGSEEPAAVIAPTN